MQACQRGDRGPVVSEVRGFLHRLGLLADDGSGDDVFDEATDRAVRGFQQSRGLRADGVVGPETYRALDEARWRLGDRVLSHVVGHPYSGDDVATLQQRLIDLGFDPGRIDGVFGAVTDAAVREFQRNIGTVGDGTVGPVTLRALEQLRRTVTGGSLLDRREEELLSRGSLAGRVVVLDPGHGGDDEGAVGAGMTEAAIALDLAARIEGRLGALGVRTFVTRGPQTCPTDAERAELANDLGADAVVSLHVDAVPSAAACGVATYFYGVEHPARRSRSAIGERLAGLVQREITSRTDLVDGRTHAKSWELLRRTRMPAIRLFAGYLSNSGDAARLATPGFRDTVAEAVAVALQRLYAAEHDTVTTGQFRLPVVD